MSPINNAALVAKQKLKAGFVRKGVLLAMLSGICYGLYTSFMTLGMTKGVWADWYGPNTWALSAFAITYLLGALGSATNDTCSGVWSLISVAIKGELGDFFRTLNTKPGYIMIVCALIGGPIASTAYVVALQMGGSVIIPITALCPAIGAILGRIVFKQQLNARMGVGITVCVLASAILGGTSFSTLGPQTAVACLIAFISAVGWGIEGCVAGFGTSVIDYQIGITIRQCTSGLSNLIIMVPIMATLAGSAALGPKVVGAAFTSPAILFFLVSGFFSMPAYALWYKGNSMCGAALGMTCNGMYSFWGPLFCWVIIGIFDGQEGWSLTPVQWIAAIIMIVGILLISMNPLDLLKKKEEVLV